MSSIYIHEPPTDGKVLLITSVGEIEIELWSKEAPKACRNFVQLCMEGYYNGTLFHRIVKDFICQGGDPTGTGTGGESIYGAPFKDEFHSRLRFTRRGLVAMANAGPDDNGSQFFFTLNPTPELDRKHTIFGKVVGDTLYNMLKLAEGDVDEKDKPSYTKKIVRTEVLLNPFDNIVPRKGPSKKEKKKKDEKQSTARATKNYGLLSFGEEALEEEELLKEVAETKPKSKSAHDLAKDPKLSTVSALSKKEMKKMKKKLKKDIKKKRKNPDGASSEDESTGDDEDDETMTDLVRKKLRKDIANENDEEEAKAFVPFVPFVPVLPRTARTEELRKEAQQLMEELWKKDEEEKPVEEEAPTDPDIIAFLEQKEKYDGLRRKRIVRDKKLRAQREDETMELLLRFQNKVHKAVYRIDENGDEVIPSNQEESTKMDTGGEEAKLEEKDDVETADSWLGHKLVFDTPREGKVIDVNVSDAERYSLYDPRNPINIRRREAGKAAANPKGNDV